MRRLLTAAALLVLAASAWAQESWYDVEIIVFARADEKYADTEVWPTDYAPLARARTTDLKPVPSGAATLEPFQQLPESALRLKAEWQKLKSDRAFEPLLHTGWRQPGLAREKAVAVRLGGSPGADTEATGLPPAELPRLEGTVQLLLSRYLHLDADLRYRTPAQTVEAAPPAANTAGDGVFAPRDELAEPAVQTPVYLLRDSRRMRSRELHYLDHPMFGLLVQVTPYEAPKKEPVKPTAVAPPAAAAPAAPVDGAKGGAIRRN